MATEPNDPEVIKRQMEETRESLAGKLEALEGRVTGVVDTVQGATESVTDTVETVKDAVQDTMETVQDKVQQTVQSVKESLDLRRQMDEHPWLILGGATAVGYLAGCLLTRPSPPRTSYGEASRPVPFTAQPRAAAPPRPAEPAPRAEEPGWLAGLGETFGGELTKLKGLAIGTLLGVVRDMVRPAVPEALRTQVTDVINGVTTKLGGETIRGPILEGGEDDVGPSRPHHEMWRQSQGPARGKGEPVSGAV